MFNCVIRIDGTVFRQFVYFLKHYLCKHSNYIDLILFNRVRIDNIYIPIISLFILSHVFEREKNYNTLKAKSTCRLKTFKYHHTRTFHMRRGSPKPSLSHRLIHRDTKITTLADTLARAAHESTRAPTLTHAPKHPSVLFFEFRNRNKRRGEASALPAVRI